MSDLDIEFLTLLQIDMISTDASSEQVFDTVGGESFEHFIGAFGCQNRNRFVPLYHRNIFHTLIIGITGISKAVLFRKLVKEKLFVKFSEIVDKYFHLVHPAPYFSPNIFFSRRIPSRMASSLEA